MINYRQDPFTGVLQPVLMQETIKVPASAPFYVNLLEFPLEQVPSSLLVRDSAATLVANPDQDCYVSQQSGLNVNEPSLLAGRLSSGAGGHIYRTYMRFNIAALPSNPSKVVLRLWLANVLGESQSQTVGIYRVTSSWTETSPTWSSQPTYDTTLMGQISISPLPGYKDTVYAGWYECDVTALYAAWKVGPNHGLMIRADEANYTYVNFASRENSAIQPQLVVINNGALYTQVGQRIVPGVKEFAASYTTAQLRFNSAAAGLTLSLDYLGLGSPVDGQDAGLAFTTTGSSSAYVVTSAGPRMTLRPFTVLYLKFHTGCANNATLNPDGLGAKNLQINGTNVTAGQLSASGLYIAMFDGTNFQVK